MHVSQCQLPPAVSSSTASAEDLRRLMRQVAQPVVVVTGRDLDGHPRGMTVSSFTSVSLEPPLVLFCAARTSATWSALAPVGAFAVNVVTAEQEGLAAAFARRRTGVSSTALAWPTDSDLPVLAEAAAIARCTVHAVHPGGDHHVVVAAVDAIEHRASGHPLSYWRGRYAQTCHVSESRCPD